MIGPRYDMYNFMEYNFIFFKPNHLKMHVLSIFFMDHYSFIAYQNHIKIEFLACTWMIELRLILITVSEPKFDMCSFKTALCLICVNFF